MVGWHHRIFGHEFEQTQGESGLGSQACYSPWGHRVRDDLATEQQERKVNPKGLEQQESRRVTSSLRS